MPGGSQSEVGKIRTVLLKHARDAFRSREEIERHWKGLGYTGPPAFSRAVAEYDRFAELLEGAGAEIRWLPPEDRTGLDSIYVRDASIAAAPGMILCRMGKPARAAEPEAQAAELRAAGVPILGSIAAPGTLEGGDAAWLDGRTLAVGRGYRTNDSGIEQLRRLLADAVDEIVVVPLPHWRGPGDVFHLMSIFSPLDSGLALVYSPLMPVPFREALLARDWRLVEVPEKEFGTMGTNVLAVGPGRGLALAGNPETRRRLERAGVEVREFAGEEICRKGAGGPTCLTRPLLREPG
jgi:N-dimethylarginine dimethylaminohydrolase